MHSISFLRSVAVFCQQFSRDDAIFQFYLRGNKFKTIRVTPGFEPALYGCRHNNYFMPLLFVPGYSLHRLWSEDGIDVPKGKFVCDLDELFFTHTFEEVGEHHLFSFVVGDEF